MLTTTTAEEIALAMEHQAAILNGEHRYWLKRAEPSRLWDDAYGRTLFVMLNPSTADAERDDMTIKKCVGFTRRFGATECGVVNLFSYRSTNPENLRAAAEINGPLADIAIEAALIWLAAKGHPNLTSRMIFAYGAPPWANRNTASRNGLFWRTGERILFVFELAALYGFKPWALGLTSGGWPRHPSRLPYGGPENQVDMALDIHTVPPAHFAQFERTEP